MKKISLLLCLFPLAASAFDSAKFQSQIAIDQRAIQEIKKFSADMPSEYASKLPRLMMRKMFQEKQTFLATIAGNPCKPSSKVTFLNAGEVIGANRYPRAEQEAVDSFEEGFIKIESVGCLKASIALEAMTEARKPSFQMSVVSELKGSRIAGSLTCDSTSVTGIGTSKYCFISSALNTATESYLFTQNVTNAPLSEASAPVYFRSILMSFHEANNQTYSHTIAYVRGAKVPGLVRSIAKTRIQQTQTNSYTKLNQSVSPR
jgi:hypothetical protein